MNVYSRLSVSANVTARLFSMRPLPSMFNWSCPHLTFAISCQGSEPFSSDLYPDFKLNLFFNLHQKYKFLPLVLGFFFWCNYGRLFWSFHQNYFLCICKRFEIPKVLFFKFHKFAPCPDFLALAMCQLPKIVAGSCWWLSCGGAELSWGGFGCARAPQIPFHQPIPPTNQPTNPARWCCCSSMD